MDEGKEIKEYRKDKSIKLFEAYKDLIDKTFEVIDKDLLQEQIDKDNDDKKESEQRYLEAIKKRRISLDEVDVMLDKIEKLEKSLNQENPEGETIPSSTQINPAKKHARSTNK